MTDLKLGLIYGSAREGRLCDKVAGWAAGEIARYGGFTQLTIDPRALALPALHERQDGHAMRILKQRIDLADAFVVVTPEYNHGYPAALKQVIDAAHSEWRHKPVAFISYGGISGGLRAVEQLRQVFAELHATTLRDTVSFAGAWSRFDAAGKLLETEEPAKAMATLLDGLVWWAGALRAARRPEAVEAVAS